MSKKIVITEDERKLLEVIFDKLGYDILTCSKLVFGNKEEDVNHKNWDGPQPPFIQVIRDLTKKVTK